MKNKKLDKNQIAILYLSLGIILIVALFLYRLNEQKMPVVLLDEFGYWANAAHFTGRDWSSIASHNSYYSYGYSLLLAILLRITNGSNVYTVALFLNLMMIIGLFILNYKTISLISPDLSKPVTVAISLITVLYPSNAGNMHIAWAELFLSFTFSLCSFFLLVFLHTRKTIYLYLWFFFCCYTYAIHQRALDIVISAIILLFMMFITKKIKFRHLIVFIIFFAFILVVHHFIKSDILDNVVIRSQNAASNVNDYPSIVDYMLGSFNLSGIKKLVFSILGKISFITIISFGSVMLIMPMVMSSAFNLENNTNYFFLFLLLVMGTEIGIVSIFTMDSARLDSVIYGRYVEWFLQPWLLLGYSYIAQNGTKNNLLKCSLLVICGSICVLKIYELLSIDNIFTFVCAQTMFIFYRIESSPYFIILAGILLGGITLFSCIFNNNHRSPILFSLVMTFLIISDFICVDRVLGSNYRSDLVSQIANEIDNNPSLPITYINDESQLKWYVADLQVYRSNIHIKETTLINDYLENEMFIMVNPYSDAGKIISSMGFEPIVANWQIALYKITR